MPSSLAHRKPWTYEEVVQRLHRALGVLRTRVAETRWEVTRARRLTADIKAWSNEATDGPVGKLVRAVSALRVTASSLRSLDDLDAFLGDVLNRMAGQVGAASAALFVAEDDEQVYLRWVVEDGQLIRGARSRHPNAGRPLRLADFNASIKSIGYRQGNPHVTPGSVGHDQENRLYLTELGVRSVVAVPVMLDDVVVASFHLRLHDDRRPPEEDIQIAQALADQTALAFRLTRLAAGARAAAVAHQEEQAARQRAESIARLSEASSSTLERLAASADPDAFLGHILSVAAEQLGAAGGSVWRADGEARALLIVSLEGGVARGPDQSQLPVSEHGGPHVQQMIARGHQLGFDDQQDFATRPEYAPFREFFARAGIRSILRVPLYLRDQYRGCMLLRFTTARRLRPEEAEMARAFGNQAVLALELARLTQSARAAAVVGERSRLARDIHDTLAQGLAAIILHLETAASMCPPPRLAPHIHAATDLARDSLIDARRSIRALRPAGLDGRTLDAALAEVTDRLARLSTAEFRVRTHGRPARLPGEVEAALLRIVSEAVTNAARHARARTIDVELTYEHPAVRVSVRDDGIGFDAASTRRNVGLSSMRERAQAIGAALTIASEPNGGTEVLVYWSVSAANAMTP